MAHVMRRKGKELLLPRVGCWSTLLSEKLWRSGNLLFESQNTSDLREDGLFIV